MIGDGIGLGVKMFRESNVTDRMLILMSDGDDTGSKIPPKTAAKLAADNDVKIYSIAMGDPENAGEHPIDTETLKAMSYRPVTELYVYPLALGLLLMILYTLGLIGKKELGGRHE